MELYIHIPFCRKKCNYCAFTSFPAENTDYKDYVDLLLKEAEERKNESNEPIKTVYIGGGTPSLLPPFLFTRMIDGLRMIFDLNHIEEFTIEANPGTVTRDWLYTAKASGANRLSFGMQAFQDSLLGILGRIHSYKDVCQSITLARETGFQNINLDLMFGIPYQTQTLWRETIDAALSLNPLHISAYGLIPEEGTSLYSDLETGALSLPDPDVEREMYAYAVTKLSQNGFHRYEISNFAKESYECMHNIGYWTQKPYIGLGLSAASMTGFHRSENGTAYVRRTNPDNMDSYRRMLASKENQQYLEKISVCESRFETLMLGLRMTGGVSEMYFQEMHGISLELCYGSKLRELEDRGLLIHENGNWRMTERGFDIQNSVLVELME